MAGSQVVTRLLYPSLGPRRIMIGGLLLLAASMSLLALVDTSTNLWWVRADMFAAGYAMAHVFVPSQAAGFATISPAATGRASTLFNALRQLGIGRGRGPAHHRGGDRWSHANRRRPDGSEPGRVSHRLSGGRSHGLGGGGVRPDRQRCRGGPHHRPPPTAPRRSDHPVGRTPAGAGGWSVRINDT